MKMRLALVVAAVVLTMSCPVRAQDSRAIDEARRILAARQLFFVIDTTVNMSPADCPGPLTRWEWSARQIQKLANDLEPTVRDVTIYMYCNAYDEYLHTNPGQLINLFKSGEPGGGSGWAMSATLNAAFNEYFNHRTPVSKPLLVVLITGAEPVRTKSGAGQAAVRSTIGEACNRMTRPDEVKLVILEVGSIGTATYGEDFFAQLAARQPGRFPIVRLCQSTALPPGGFVRAIADAAAQ